MMKYKINNDNRGLTLLELLVGVAILAVIVTPLLHTFVTGANTARKSKQYRDATLAAQNIIEQIEATDMEAYLDGAALVTDEDDINYGKYVKKEESVSSGGTEFDARIIIDTDSELNGSDDNPFEIPFSNQMDAVFAMQDVDDIARELFEGSADKDFSKLERYITIDVDYASAEDTATCKVTVTFEYEDRAKKTLNNDGKEPSESISFNYPIVNEMNVTPRSDEGDAFAVYLFFKASVNTDFIMHNTVINNKTNYDFNVFLVDVGDDTGSIAHEVDYKPTKQGTIAGLFTNMGNVNYSVYKSSNPDWHDKPEPVEVGLVQTGAITRVYDISVEIYKHDPEQDYSGKLLAMETSKLDYSAQ